MGVRQYTELAKTVKIKFTTDPDCMKRCKICKEFTINRALISTNFYYEYFELCDKHNDEATVRKLFLKEMIKE